MFPLAKLVLTLLFLVSTLLLGETKAIALVEVMLGKGKSYPKSVQS